MIADVKLQYISFRYKFILHILDLCNYTSMQGLDIAVIMAFSSACCGCTDQQAQGDCKFLAFHFLSFQGY